MNLDTNIPNVKAFPFVLMMFYKSHNFGKLLDIQTSDYQLDHESRFSYMIHNLLFSYHKKLDGEGDESFQFLLNNH